ncbi:LacI family transcriptional regulator [Balneicella halophila]|uniref:LacI family transcriptional regulator n=1 Tax=Balneicella halophila TaxID=1537566 RepID=A0A7L4UQQ5_BALHA|nr:LacI family DNA-binding transcriptional regulator [Balneicella halophila]PVX51771.1 LacI family transcriptional regulator [Balneicella halophila]
MKRAVTIKDIAKKLNIAPSTVSRALKDHKNISDATKRKVKELAEQLNYQPNFMATSLKNNTSNVIGVVIPEFIHYFFSTVLSGIEDIAYDQGYRVIFTQSSENYDREVKNIHTLLANRVDGILMSISKNTDNFEHIKCIKANGVPLVLFDRITKEVEADYIVINDFFAAKNAVSHLIKTGCKEIAFFGTLNNLLITQNRKNGYKDALREARIPIKKELMFNADSYEEAYSTVFQILNSQTPIDAIFTVNDSSAIGALTALKEFGKRVPEDVSIIGFTDSMISRVCEPPLTTISQNGYKIGQEATKILLERIKNNDDYIEYSTTVLKTELLLRGTTK